MFNDQQVKVTLERFYPASAIRCMGQHGTKFVTLNPGQRFDSVSPTLRRIRAGVDAWPLPPAGLFVVEERTVYLRSTSPMTICHEAGHALDCALGTGVYLSSTDARIRRAFARATAFVTPYAASACDEYMAECLRSWVGANDPVSIWPEVSRERLATVDPRMHAILEGDGEDLERRFGGQTGEQLVMEFAA